RSATESSRWSSTRLSSAWCHGGLCWSGRSAVRYPAWCAAAGSAGRLDVSGAAPASACEVAASAVSGRFVRRTRRWARRRLLPYWHSHEDVQDTPPILSARRSVRGSRSALLIVRLVDDRRADGGAEGCA